MKQKNPYAAPNMQDYESPARTGSSLTYNWDQPDTPPPCPIVLSIPHAGRNYPSALLAQARLPMEKLRLLEDAWVDIMAEQAITAGFPAIVATRARAAIDMNRAVDDIDAAMIMDVQNAPALFPGHRSKMGLGLFPCELPGSGPLWRTRFAWGDLQTRIDEDYWPYHNALSDALTLRRHHHGGAILIDVHSMPPPRKGGRDVPVDIVFGTLHGQSCDAWLASALERSAHALGLRSMRNDPYAGGHILAHHGRPMRNQHAIQIEISRALYLGADHRCDAAGTSAVQTILLSLADAARVAWGMHMQSTASALPIAAE